MTTKMCCDVKHKVVEEKWKRRETRRREEDEERKRREEAIPVPDWPVRKENPVHVPAG